MPYGRSIIYTNNISLRFFGNNHKNINNKIKDAGRYYYESPMNPKILSKFSRISVIAHKDKIYGNDTEKRDVVPSPVYVLDVMTVINLFA